MRNSINEGLVRFRQREMQAMAKRRHLGNAVVQSKHPPRDPFYVPLLAFAGVVLSRLGRALQERYSRVPAPEFTAEAARERQ